MKCHIIVGVILYITIAGNSLPIEEPTGNLKNGRNFRFAVSQLVKALKQTTEDKPRSLTFRAAGPERIQIPQANYQTINFQNFQVKRKTPDSAESSNIKLPPPVVVSSEPLKITAGGSGGKRGRSLKTVDVQGVPVIVGVRVPDDPEDKFFTWRNARVIKGKLVPNENSQVPSPVTILSSHNYYQPKRDYPNGTTVQKVLNVEGTGGAKVSQRIDSTDFKWDEQKIRFFKDFLKKIFVEIPLQKKTQ